jgi:hypothetical protein
MPSLVHPRQPQPSSKPTTKPSSNTCIAQPSTAEESDRSFPHTLTRSTKKRLLRCCVVILSPASVPLRLRVLRASAAACRQVTA